MTYVIDIIELPVIFHWKSERKLKWVDFKRSKFGPH